MTALSQPQYLQIEALFTPKGKGYIHANPLAKAQGAEELNLTGFLLNQLQQRLHLVYRLLIYTTAITFC